MGLDFLAHPFWDKYIEFEERFEAHDKVFALLTRVIAIPMHQYARYFEKYRTIAASRPVNELAPQNLFVGFQAEVLADPTLSGRGELEVDRAMRARLDNYHLDIFNNTQTETTKRWTYEQNIKRPYFHVTELDQDQLENWQKYLDFEESEGDYSRTAFLYERCVVTCAQYDEFWTRFVRWMYAQDGHEEEVRSVYQRACCLYVPIAKPAIRIMWSLFEEMSGRPTVAAAIYEAILVSIPGHIEAIIGLANLQRRQYGYDAAVQVYQKYIADAECPSDAKGALTAEMARLAYKTKGSPDEARGIFQSQWQTYLDSSPFWTGYLGFEMDQITVADTEGQQYQRIRSVHDDIRRKSRLAPEVIRELSQKYMVYLTERNDKDAAKEYMDLDVEVNGPASVVTLMHNKANTAVKTMPSTTANGHNA